MNPTKPVSKAHPLIKQVLRATFPEYRGRKVRIREYDGPQTLTVCWDEGSRDSVKVIVFDRGVGSLHGGSPFTNPMGCLARVDQPAGSLLVVHSISCGRDVGITITARPGERDLMAGDLAGLLR
jgi:hypothetical protein